MTSSTLYIVFIEIVLLVTRCSQLIQARVQCGGLFLLRLDKPEVTIKSPGYGVEYPINTECQWTVVSAVNKPLVAKFSDMDIEYQSTCPFDRLLVDSWTCDFQNSSVLCGNVLPAPIVTSGRILCLRFISDMLVQKRGFVVKVQLAESSNLTSTLAVQYPSRRKRSAVSVPKIPCSSFPVLIHSDVIIFTPAVAGTWWQYQSNTVCRWLVMDDSLHQVLLQFDLNEQDRYDLCHYEKLRVIEGEEMYPVFSVDFCDPVITDQIPIQGPKLVIFSSDSIIQARSITGRIQFISVSVETTLISNTPTNDQRPTTTSESTRMSSISTFFNYSKTNEYPQTPEPMQQYSTFDYSGRDFSVSTKKSSIAADTTETTMKSTTPSVADSTPKLAPSSGISSTESAFPPVITMCNQTYYRMAGNQVIVESPDFGGQMSQVSMRCDVVVVTEKQKALNARILSMDLGDQQMCESDWLEISFRSTQSGKICGQSASDLTTDDYVMLLTFVTESMNAGMGFQLRIESVASAVSNNHSDDETSMCDSLMAVIDDGHMILTSPGYSRGEYPANTTCDLKLFTQDDKRLQVTVLDFETDWNFGCSYDYVVSFDGVDPNSKSIARMCGVVLDQEFVTSGPAMLIRFVSDSVSSKRGFRLRIDQVDTTQKLDSISASTTSTSLTISLLTETTYTTATPTTATPTTATPTTATPTTTTPTTTTVITITTPTTTAPTTSAPTTAATSSITTTTKSTTISLTTTSATTISATTQTSTTPTTMLTATTSTATPITIATTTTTTSQYQTSTPTYYPDLESACSGVPSVRGESSGAITSPGFSPGTSYPVDMKCKWIIEGAEGKTIFVYFTSFNLESSPGCLYDFLEIFNVTNDKRSLIGRFCGNTLPGNITSTDHSLEIVFETDRMVTMSGFNLTYSVLGVINIQSECPVSRVPCKGSSVCIPPEWYCDSEQDCPFGEDEHNCETCGDNEFTCSDNSCLALYHVCDGITQCPHSEDESHCTKIDQDGLLWIRKEGEWFPVCADGWGDKDFLETNSLWACSSLGEGNPISISNMTLPLVAYFLHLTVNINKEDDIDESSQSAASKYSVLQHVSATCDGNVVVQLNCSIKECGHRGAHLPQPYVIGSSSSVDGQWPWTAAVFSGTFFRCGASLVSDHWVVTAGHCIYNMLNSPQTTTILVGNVNIKSPDAVMIRVTEIVIHPENNYIYNNDIALLRLEEPITVNDNQRPICLSDAPKERSPSLLCYVSGWGVSNVTVIATAELSTILHHVKLKLWEQSKCEKSYPSQIKPTMLCAGYYSGEMDACKGDSGGPLMCQSQPDQWELVGIVSWGEGCGQIGKPGVYTRVDFYLKWIQSVISNINKEGVTCDFEHPDLCGYSSQSQSDFAWSRRSGGVHFPIMPDMDNTYKNTSGHYAYTYVPYGANQKTAVLNSPPLLVTEGASCLHASMIIYQCELCKLQVKVVYNNDNLSGDLLQVSSKFSTSWLRFNLDIPLSTQQIKFISTSGQWSGGGIGLDDVTLEPGVCENTMKVNCNFNNQPKSMNQLNGGMCSYTQESFTDDFDWFIAQDKDTGDGFLRAKNAFGYQGYRARILSPKLKTFISMCVSFKFRASSRSAGFLQVCRQLSVRDSDSIDCSFWSSRFNAFLDPTSWTSVHVILPSSDLEFSVIFQMVQGQGQGYIDIDDVFRLDGDCL